MKRIFFIATIVTITTIAFGSNNLRLCVSAEIFSPNLQIEGNLSDQAQPSITIDDFGKIYVVWRDYRNDPSLPSNGRGDIYFTNSTDGGISFNIVKKVSDDSGDTQQNIPSVAVDSGGAIHVVWEDWRNDADGRRIGGGGVDGINNGDIYYASSTNGGTTWSESKMINDDGGTTQQGRPEIAVDNNDVIHIVWEDRRKNNNFSIYYTNSTDSGLSFSINKKVSDVDVGARDPAIAIDEGNNIHVTWCDYRNSGTTGPDIYYTNSTDGGITFSSNKRVSDDTSDTYQYWPDIAVGGGIIGIVWEDARGTDIYFSNSTDGGITFSPNKKVSNPSPGIDDDASIAINDTGYIAITWVEGSNGNIAFINSTNGGDTFSLQQKINDDVGAHAHYLPSIAVDDRGQVYVAWQDNRDGNWNIYFSRSNFPPSMATPISPPEDSTLSDNIQTLVVTPVTDLDSDTVYYNFTISDQPGAESGTAYYSGWIESTSWTTPELIDGKWYWHTYTSDIWNITSPNWVWNFTIDAKHTDYVPINIIPTSPKKVSIGSANPISVQVKNTGDEDASVFSTIAFYNQTMLPLNTSIISPLAIDEISPTCTATWVAPETPGTYYMVIEVDYGKDISESNEDNNNYTIEFIVVDTPITTIHIDTPKYGTTPTFVTNETLFSFAVQDSSGTGIKSTSYRIDLDGTWATYTEPFTISIEGAHTIYYNSTDNLDGGEDAKEFDIVVDNTPPTTTIAVSNPNYGGNWVTSETEFNLSAIDGSLIPAGINNTKYRIWNGTWSDWCIYQDEFIIGSGDGLRYVEFYSVDWLGNIEANITLIVYLDNAPPTTSINPYAKDGKTTKVDTKTEFTLTAVDNPVDNCSGVKSIWYKIDNGDWINYTTTGKFAIPKGEHTIYFYSVDNLSNAEPMSSIQVVISEEKANMLLILLFFVIVVIVIIIILFLYLRYRKREEKQTLTEGEKRQTGPLRVEEEIAKGDDKVIDH